MGTDYGYGGRKITGIWVDETDILAKADFAELGKKVMANPSPTKAGNVRCMDCRCDGFGCPGMPPGYEQRLMENW